MQRYRRTIHFCVRSTELAVTATCGIIGYRRPQDLRVENNVSYYYFLPHCLVGIITDKDSEKSVG